MIGLVLTDGRTTGSPECWPLGAYSRRRHSPGAGLLMFFFIMIPPRASQLRVQYMIFH
jgi:hypothetical protein